MWPINWASDVSHAELETMRPGWVQVQRPSRAACVVSCPLGAMCRERTLPYSVGNVRLRARSYRPGIGAAAGRRSRSQQLDHCPDVCLADTRATVHRSSSPIVLFDRQALKLQYMARLWFLLSSGSTSPEPNFYYSYDGTKFLLLLWMDTSTID